MNPTIELLKSHRSIRKFTDQKISRELFRDLIRAGQCAASSNHVQAYSIIHVMDPDNRRKIAELAGGQDYIADCSDFLVFCADMKRPTEAAGRAGAEVVRGMTEQLLVSTIDTSLMAQNVAVAAESEGLGLCYIGGIRNNPAPISEILRLPEHVYPVFGMCLGWPAEAPKQKPRMDLGLTVHYEKYDTAGLDEKLDGYDAELAKHYDSVGKETTRDSWTYDIDAKFAQPRRDKLREQLKGMGFDFR